MALRNLAVRVRVDGDGGVASFAPDFTKDSKNAGQLFTAAIERAVRQSRFKPECAGREIELVYDFRLPDINDPEGRISFQPPNRIEIFARHAVVQ